MNMRVHADPSRCRAERHRDGDDWREGSVDHHAAGPTIPRGEPGDGHDRVDGARTGQEQAGEYHGVQANGCSPHHHAPELNSDPSHGLGGHRGADASGQLGSLTVLIGGFAAASGDLTLASGAVQSTAQDRAGVSINWGEAVFDALSYGVASTETFAAADTWLLVTGADLVLRWDFENSGSDPGADQAWAHSEIDYMAIDIHSWSPPRPTVIELEQAFALQPPAADLGPFGYGSLNFAAVVAAVQAEGPNALALTSTQAFTDSQFSFVYAMALTAL